MKATVPTSNPETIDKAKRLRRRMDSCCALLGALEPDSFLYKHVKQEQDDAKVELMAIVARADAHDDVDLLKELGVGK